MVGNIANIGEEVVLNRVILILEPNIALREMNDIANDIHGAVIYSYNTFPGYLVEFDIIRNSIEHVMDFLITDPRVQAVYPNELIDVSGLASHYSFQPGSGDPTGIETARNLIASVPTDQKSHVRVAIIDDGILFPVGILVNDSLRDEITDLDQYNQLVTNELRKQFDWQRIVAFNIDEQLDKLFDLVRNDGPESDIDGRLRETLEDFLELQRNEPDTWENIIRKNSALFRYHGTAVSSIFVREIKHDNGTSLVPVINYELQIHFTGGNGLTDSNFDDSKIDSAAVTAALEAIFEHRGSIDIVNMSFVSPNKNQVWLDLIEMIENDVLFVVAAGNDGASVPKQCTRDASGVVPALWSLSVSNVVTVAATERSGMHRALWGGKE